MTNIECEVRSFISEEQYQGLVERLKRGAVYHGEDTQVTYYFDAQEDLRIQLNNSYSKIWLKKGKLHDEDREEIEIRAKREDFEKLEQLFIALGYQVQIKWFRTRHAFTWGNIEVAVDYTKGYGYIIELERISDETNKEKTITELKKKLAELGIPLTPKEDFNQRYEWYKMHWKEVV